MNHPNEDLALLIAGEDLVPAETVPLIHVAGTFSEFEGFGFGVGNFPNNSDGIIQPSSAGSHLIQGHFQVLRIDPLRLLAVATTEGGRVCDGDSGGPALMRTDGNREAIAGVLQASSGDLECTPPGGDQSWIRLGPYLHFFESILGHCEKIETSGYTLARCVTEANVQQSRDCL
jgi:hypothetical protein